MEKETNVPELVERLDVIQKSLIEGDGWGTGVTSVIPDAITTLTSQAAEIERLNKMMEWKPIDELPEEEAALLHDTINDEYVVGYKDGAYERSRRWYIRKGIGLNRLDEGCDNFHFDKYQSLPIPQGGVG